eukprot:1141056-Pelagomonas_calceolata.AAC.3
MKLKDQKKDNDTTHDAAHPAPRNTPGGCWVQKKGGVPENGSAGRQDQWQRAHVGGFRRSWAASKQTATLAPRLSGVLERTTTRGGKQRIESASRQQQWQHICRPCKENKGRQQQVAKTPSCRCSGAQYRHSRCAATCITPRRAANRQDARAAPLAEWANVEWDGSCAEGTDIMECEKGKCYQ